MTRPAQPAKLLLLAAISAAGLTIAARPLEQCLGAEPVVWRSGAEFRLALDARGGIAWSQYPLREALDNLSRKQRVAILLDRRVDPQQKLDLSVVDTPLRDVLRGLAEQLDLGICFFDGVVYLGPKETALKLPTLRAVRMEELRRLPVAARSRLARRQVMSWEMLSTPRDIMARLADATPLRVESMQQIPHDLWPAEQLPALPLVDRLTLLLAGFDLTFEWADEGAAVRLIPVSQLSELQRTYRVPGGAGDVADRLSRQFPRAKIRADGNQIQVTAGFSDHDAIRRLLDRTSSDSTAAATDLARINIDRLNVQQQSVGGVMKYLAERLQLELVFDPRLTPRLQKRISLELENVTYREAFQAVLDPAGLSFRLEESRLEIVQQSP